jgi:hypothetical protein
MKDSMIRIAIALALVGCAKAVPAPVAPKPAPVVVVEATKPKPAPTPNAVCEAFKGVNGAAACAPGHTDIGDLHIHTATVTLGQQQFACRTDFSMLGVLCGDPIVIKQQPPPPTQDVKLPVKAKPPAKAKK